MTLDEFGIVLFFLGMRATLLFLHHLQKPLGFLRLLQPALGCFCFGCFFFGRPQLPGRCWRSWSCKNPSFCKSSTLHTPMDHPRRRPSAGLRGSFCLVFFGVPEGKIPRSLPVFFGFLVVLPVFSKVSINQIAGLVGCY